MHKTFSSVYTKTISEPFQKSHSGDRSQNLRFGAQKRRLLLDGEENPSFQSEGCSVKIAQYWPRSIYY